MQTIFFCCPLSGGNTVYISPSQYPVKDRIYLLLLLLLSLSVNQFESNKCLFLSREMNLLMKISIVCFCGLSYENMQCQQIF